MGVYVDAEDIRQHFRQAGALDDETIEEVMGEQEEYVRARLRLPSLPPGNPIFASIVRDLTIAAGIFTLLPAGSADYDKAVAMRGEALRKLVEVEDDGVGIRPPTSTGSSRWENEVINDFPAGSFFKPSDFGL